MKWFHKTVELFKGHLVLVAKLNVLYITEHSYGKPLDIVFFKSIQHFICKCAVLVSSRQGMLLFWKSPDKTPNWEVGAGVDEGFIHYVGSDSS